MPVQRKLFERNAVNDKGQAMSTDQDARKKRNRRLISIIAVLIVLSIVVFLSMPKSVDISKSEYFTREQMEAAIKGTIELLDAGDYAALREKSNEEMQSVFNEETLQPAKKEISENWGELQDYGTMKITEVSKKDVRYVVGEVVVTYEQVSVTYRITYDQDLRVAGLYMK